MTVLDAKFPFTDKADARSYFQKLRQVFLDWNTSPYGSEKFEAAGKIVDQLIETGLNA
jgi:hypothetical protein